MFTKKEKKTITKYKKNLKEEKIKSGIANKFLGRSLTEENKNLYRLILTHQKELVTKHGTCQISGLSNSVRNYAKIHKLGWNEKKVLSTRKTIEHHLKRKHLP